MSVAFRSSATTPAASRRDWVESTIVWAASIPATAPDDPTISATSSSTSRTATDVKEPVAFLYVEHPIAVEATPAEELGRLGEVPNIRGRFIGFPPMIQQPSAASIAGPGNTQNWGQISKSVRDSFGGFNPGEGCNGHTAGRK